MTVKELKEALSLFPDDRKVVIFSELGDPNGYFGDYFCGKMEVNCLKELPQALDKKLEGAIEILHLFKPHIKEVEYQNSWHKRQYGVTPMLYVKTEDGKHFIDTTGQQGKEFSQVVNEADTIEEMPKHDFIDLPF